MADLAALGFVPDTPNPQPTGGGPDLKKLGFQDDLQKLGFVPDQEVQPQTTKTQSALEGFGNAATAGYLPQLQAGARNFVDTSMFPGTPGNVDKNLEAQGFQINQPIDNYETNKKENIERQQLEAKEHPGAYYGGAAAGALATAPLAGRALGLIPGLAAAPEAGLLVKTAKGVAGGGLMGAAQNPGESDTVGEDLKQRGMNALVGGGIGGAGTLAAQGVSKALSGAKDYLSDMANSRAIKALGLYQIKDAKKMLGNGQMSKLGQFALDNGIVSPGDSIESSALKAANLRHDTGEQIGDIYKNVVNKVEDPKFLESLPPAKRATIESSQINPKQFATEMMGQYGNLMRGKIGNTVAGNKLATTLDEIAQNGDKVDVAKANSIIKDLSDDVNYSIVQKERPVYQQAISDIRNRLRDQVNAHVATIDQALGSQDSQKLVKLNDLYHNLSDANELMVKAVARDNANRAISLTDSIAGVGGGISGALVGAAKGHTLEGALLGHGLGAVNHAGRKFGPAIQASLANKGAQGLETLSQIPGAGLIGQGLDAVQNASSAGIGAGAAQILKGPPEGYKKGPVKR